MMAKNYERHAYTLTATFGFHSEFEAVLAFRKHWPELQELVNFAFSYYNEQLISESYGYVLPQVYLYYLDLKVPFARKLHDEEQIQDMVAARQLRPLDVHESPVVDSV